METSIFRLSQLDCIHIFAGFLFDLDLVIHFVVRYNTSIDHPPGFAVANASLCNGSSTTHSQAHTGSEVVDALAWVQPARLPSCTNLTGHLLLLAYHSG